MIGASEAKLRDHAAQPPCSDLSNPACNWGMRLNSASQASLAAFVLFAMFTWHEHQEKANKAGIPGFRPQPALKAPAAWYPAPRQPAGAAH